MKTIVKTLLLIAASAASSTVALGDSLTLTAGSYSNGGSGGAYTAAILSGPANNGAYSSLATLSATSFETFCLEPTEYFSSGSTYNYTIASFADGGANEAAGRNATFGDQLSQGTTWLYSRFAQGLLDSSTYSSATRKAAYLQLQRAFWYLEDDYTGYGSAANALSGNVFLTLVAKEFGGGVASVSSLAAAQADAVDGANGVLVLNITTPGTGTKNQSQLYYVPDSGLTAVMLGLALIGIAGLRRKISVG